MFGATVGTSSGVDGWLLLAPTVSTDRGFSFLLVFFVAVKGRLFLTLLMATIVDIVLSHGSLNDSVPAETRSASPYESVNGNSKLF